MKKFALILAVASLIVTIIYGYHLYVAKEEKLDYTINPNQVETLNSNLEQRSLTYTYTNQTKLTAKDFISAQADITILKDKIAVNEITFDPNNQLSDYQLVVKQKNQIIVFDIILDYSRVVNVYDLTSNFVGYVFKDENNQIITSDLEGMLNITDLSWYRDENRESEALLNNYYDNTIYAKATNQDTILFNDSKIVISFDTNGGNTVEPIFTNIDSNLSYIPVPVKAGYAFTGWYIDSNLVTNETIFTTNQLLVASWQLTNYTINYQLFDGINNESNPTSYNYLTKEIIKPATKDGYLFKGWYLDINFKEESKINGLDKMVDDITLYAKFEILSYTIKYQTDATHFNPSTYDVSKTLEFDKAIKSGYTFTGWSTSPDQKNYLSSTEGLYQNLVLYPTFSPNTYSINYYLHDGINHEENPQTFTVEAPVVLKEPVKDGYTFVGWYKTERFIKANHIDELNDIPHDIDLHAYFVLNSDAIIYHDIHDAQNTNLTSYNNQEEVFFTALKLNGYNFDGWYTDEAYQNKILSTKDCSGILNLYAKWSLIEYSIDYQLDEGINHEKNVFSYNIESAIILYPATKDGYTFEGWYTSNDFNEDTKVTSWQPGKTGNQALYAKFSPKVYNLYYQIPEGAQNGNPTTYSAAQEEYLRFISLAGYYYDGWYTDDSFTNRVNTTEGFSGDVMLYAKMVPVDYRVDYYLDGGKLDGKNPEKYNIETNAILNNPTKDGYTFLGWYRTNTSDEEQRITEFKGNFGYLTLYARWEKEKLNITYHDVVNATNDNQDFYYVDQILTFNNPVKLGYDFLGWYSDATYQNLITATKDQTKDLNLYPKWNITNYSINYQLNLGTNHIDNVSSYNIESAIILYPATKNGHTFEGWYSSNDFNEDTKVTSWQPGKTGNQALYAKFNPKDYTITYQVPEGVENYYNPTTYNVGDDQYLRFVSRPGYVFAGWYTDYLFENEVSSTDELNGDVMLYAKMEPIDYLVDYFLNGGKLDGKNPEKYNIETPYTLSNPTKEGYTFLGWYRTNTPIEEQKVTELKGDMGYLLLYALWEKEKISILYHDVENATNDNPSHYYFDEVITLNDPVKPGSNFLGWYSDSRYTTPVTTILGYKKVVNLFPLFEQLIFNVGYDAKDGTNSLYNPTTVTYDSYIQLHKPILADYNFVGWYKNIYTPQEELVTTISNTTTDLFLTAKYEEIVYHVTYHNIFDADNSMNPTQFKYGEMEGIDLLMPTRRGYSFVGWFRDANFTSDIYSLEGIKSDINIYAGWVKFRHQIYLHNELPGVYLESNYLEFSVGTEVTPPVLSSPHHIFKGWYSDPSFSEDSKIEVIDDNYDPYTIYLYPKWEAIEYTIEYIDTYGAKNDNPTTYKVYSNYQLLEIKRDHYNFNHWIDDSNNRAVYGLEQLKGDVVLRAFWSPSIYGITYNLDGGHKNQANPEIISIESVIDLKDSYKENYTFAGWFTKADFSLDSKVTRLEGIAQNVELFAKFEPNEYQITYRGVNEEDHSNPSSYLADQLIQFKAPTVNGYLFKGWSLTNNPSQLVSSNRDLSGNIVLYAILEPVFYNVTYIAPDATHNNPTSVRYQTIIPLLNAKLEGSGFLGWFRDLNDSESKVSVIGDVAQNLVLYAKFVEGFNSVIYYLDGGVNHLDNKSLVSNTDSLKLENPTKDGYKFLGWYSDSLYTKEITTISNISSDIIVYAKWEKVSYKIRYHLNGSNHPSNPSSFDILNPAYFDEPTFVGSTFDGWYLDQQLTQRISSSNGYFHDLDLYAKEIATVYTIYYAVYGGEYEYLDEAHFSKDNVVFFKEPSLKNHTFFGWSQSTIYDKSFVINSTEGIYKDIVLHALWTKETFEINYDYTDSYGSNPKYYEADRPVYIGRAERDGYEFVHWKLDSGEIIENTEGKTGTLNLTAVWERYEYELHYEFEDGENHPDNPSSFNVEEIVYFKEPSLNGRTFLYWQTYDYRSGKYVTIDSTEGLLRSYSLIPVYIENSYSIDYQLDGGIFESGVEFNYTYGYDGVEFSTPIKEGFVFGGWHLEDYFESKVLNTRNMHGDIVLYAKWIPIVYQIDYVLDSGTAKVINPNAQYYSVDNIVYFDRVSKPGYRFTGWYLDENFSVEVVSTEGLVGNLVVFVKWEPIFN